MPQQFLMKMPDNNIKDRKCQNMKHVGKWVTKIAMGQHALLMALLRMQNSTDHRNCREMQVQRRWNIPECR